MGVTEEAIRLRLFPLSLSNRAKQWLTSEPPDSIISWAYLVHKFLTKYCPPTKTAQMRIEINNFAQKDSESLTETWDKYPISEEVSPSWVDQVDADLQFL